MKPLQISLENAKDLLVKMPELAESIYATYPELKPSVVLNSWFKLHRVTGYYIDNKSEIVDINGITRPSDKNIFATEKQAESALAYAQLTQLMKVTGDCDVDWNTSNTKYIIVGNTEGLVISTTYTTYYHLSFNTEEIASEFMKKHEQLINQFYQR